MTRRRSGTLGVTLGDDVATMGLGLAAMLAGVALTACSLGSSSPESDPEPREAAMSTTAPTRSSSLAGHAAPDAAPRWVDVQDSRRRAAAFAGKRCMGYRPTLLGTPGDDRIRATSRRDVIITLSGNDVVGPKGGERQDIYCTGTGDDTILLGPRTWARVVPGPGDDVIRGHARRDSVRHGHGTCIDLSGAQGPVRIDLARGRATGQGHDRFPRNIRCADAGRFNDVLLGTPRNDELDPGYGADLVRAGAGDDDVLSGWTWYWPARGEGGDRIYLGPGDDTVNGGPGPDRLYGGPGSDSLAGGLDSDYLDGGPGDDDLHSGYYCLDTEEPGPPPFLAEVCIDADPNEVFGRSGNDLLSGDLGNDRLDGGPGFDTGGGGYHDGRIDWITSIERPHE